MFDALDLYMFNPWSLLIKRRLVSTCFQSMILFGPYHYSVIEGNDRKGLWLCQSCVEVESRIYRVKENGKLQSQSTT